MEGIVVERVPHAAPELGLRAGELIVSFRAEHKPATAHGHPDARVQAHGLGAFVQAERAAFSRPSGRCLDAHMARPLRHWSDGRAVTVTIRIGDGARHHDITRRVEVVPFNLGESEQAYATTVLDCFSIVR